MQSVNHSAPAKITRERGRGREKERWSCGWILQHSYKSVGWGRGHLAGLCMHAHVMGGGGVGVQLASYIAHVQHNGNMCTVV